MFGEVLEAFDWFEPKTSDDGQRGISQGGEDLWRMARVGAGLVLTQSVTSRT